MDGEQEERPGQEEAIVAAKRSVEQARANLDEKEKAVAKRELGGWLVKMRESRFLRGPVKRLAALFLGVPLSASAVELDRPDTPSEPTEAVAMLDAEVENPLPERLDAEPALDEADLALNALVAQLAAEHPDKLTPIERATLFEARSPETDQFYLFEVAQVGKAIENGQAAPEYYARVGRPEWTPYQRSLFASAPVQERFTELHPEYRGLSGSAFLDAYPSMMKTATTEFRFSNQYRFLTEDATTAFAEIAPDMDPAQAVKQYDALALEIGRDVGLSGVVKMTEAVVSRLPDDHPLVLHAEARGIEDVKSLIGRSKKNIVHMDQARGQMRVLRQIGSAYVLVDSFPAIGGPLNTPEMSVAGKPSGSEFVHVPDTVMKVAYVERTKTSWSWHNSWVPQGAPIREAGDELQYQHPATKDWYDLTGSNAGFFPDKDGHVLKPFDRKFEPMDVGLVRAATHRSPDGSVEYVPKAWTKEDILRRTGGEMPIEWKWNDFGSTAIRLNTADGQRTRINIHSKPNEDTNDFLSQRTHGCLATYGDYIKDLTDTYGVGGGSTVVVTTEYGYDLKEML